MVTSSLGIVALPGLARADAAGSLVQQANSARATAGVAPLAVSGDLAAAAARQAASMARSGVLAHTPNLSSAVCCWVAIGENVGEGPSTTVVHAAFLASPAHRANLLNSAYTQVGVGTAVDARGIVWVSEIFRRPSGAAPAPKPAPPVTPVVTHRPTPAPSAAHRAAVSAPPVLPAAPPPARPVSRALDRPPLDVAAQFAASGSVTGANPVDRLLDFAAKAAAPY
jgi:Cysteine-rich secretory protein family